MKILLLIAVLFVSVNLFSQDVGVLLKEASNLERSLKEESALDKYKEVITVDPNNIQSLVRASELSAAIGARQADKKAKQDYYEKARDYAEKALIVNTSSADANFARALVASKLTEVETDNKKLVADIKDIKNYADKALSINPNHGKANYIFGKWNFDMIALPWTKKAALKVLFGGIPDASILNAFKYMEKCCVLEPYYVLNFLDLAKAYRFDNQPAKAIEVLNQLVKLPTRTADDLALKAEGKRLLSEMQ